METIVKQNLLVSRTFFLLKNIKKFYLQNKQILKLLIRILKILFYFYTKTCAVYNPSKKIVIYKYLYLLSSIQGEP